MANEDAESRKHTLAIYRLLPRRPGPGRRPKQEPRERVWFLGDIPEEALESLEKLMRADLGPGTVLERDGVPIAWGPKVPEKREVEVSGYHPADPPPAVAELLHNGTVSPEQLSALATVPPSEAVRFSLEVLWDTYQRTTQATDELLARNARLSEEAMKQRESFTTLLQRTSELELEMKAIMAEERVRQAERARATAQAEFRAEREESRVNYQEVVKTILEFMRGQHSSRN